jgi:hypothetical protein
MKRGAEIFEQLKIMAVSTSCKTDGRYKSTADTTSLVSHVHGRYFCSVSACVGMTARAENPSFGPSRFRSRRPPIEAWPMLQSRNNVEDVPARIQQIQSNHRVKGHFRQHIAF